MIGWKDSETVAGFLVRVAESNIPIGLTERLQFLYLLAFASTEFSLSIACVFSEVENDRQLVAEWVRVFMRGVEHRLGSGLPEMDVLSMEQKGFMVSAFQNTFKNLVDVEEGSLVTALKLEIMTHPAMIEPDVGGDESGAGQEDFKVSSGHTSEEDDSF